MRAGHPSRRRSTVRALGIAFGFGICVGGAGCGEFIGGGQSLENFRLVSGTLKLPDDGVVGRQVTALQIAAVAMVAVGGGENGLVVEPVVFTSAPFDPAVNNGEAAFVVAVDNTVSFNLVLQVPSGSGQGPGDYLGVLGFEDGLGVQTTLIPDTLTDLVLGEVRAFDADPSMIADNRLEVSTGQNPLGQLDTDGDGSPDLFDEDDDADGIADALDPDRAGDGLDDSIQALAQFPDTDGDGEPDLFE